MRHWLGSGAQSQSKWCSVVFLQSGTLLPLSGNPNSSMMKNWLKSCVLCKALKKARTEAHNTS